MVLVPTRCDWLRLEPRVGFPNGSTLELSLRIKPKIRKRRHRPDEFSVPVAPNQGWSMSFMKGLLVDSGPFRTFNVFDDYNRDGLSIEVDHSLPSTRVTRALE